MATMVVELQDWHKTDLDFETLKSFKRNISAFINWKYYILISFEICFFLKQIVFRLLNNKQLQQKY